jgi:hypothetical protein
LKELKERDYLKDLDVDGANITIYIKEMGFEVADRVHVAQDGVQWRTHADKVMNLHFQ